MVMLLQLMTTTMDTVTETEITYGQETTMMIIMVLMTMVARVADGLPLAASIQEDEQVGGVRTFIYI